MRRLRAIAAFAAGTIAAVAVLELGLKAIKATPLWRVLPVVEPVLGQPDPDTGYSFTPGATGIWVRENRAPVTINSLGLRDDEMALAKPAGTLRVGLLGDSFTEAVQVDHGATFEALAEHKVNRQGHAVEIANLAMSGNGPLRQLVRLETVGSALGLDLVVSFTSIGDFSSGELLDDSTNPGFVPTADGRLERGYAFRSRRGIRLAATESGRLLLGLIQHSEVVRLLYLRGRDPLPILLGLPVSPGATPKPTSAGGCNIPTLGQLKTFWQDREPARHWQAAAQVLEEFSAHGRRTGVPAVFALDGIPIPPEGCTAEWNARHRLVQAVASVFAAKGLGFVDVNGALLAKGHQPLARLRGFGLVRGRGGHLNHEGHRAYADILSDIVSANINRPR